RLPGDPVVLALVGDLAFPLALAEPDLLVPLHVLAVLLLDRQHAVHELRELLEVRPLVVGLGHRHGDVRPALDRQTPRLLAPAATAAATAAERLARDRAEHAALRPQLRGRVLTDLGRLVAALVLEPRH